MPTNETPPSVYMVWSASRGERFARTRKRQAETEVESANKHATRRGAVPDWTVVEMVPREMVEALERRIRELEEYADDRAYEVNMSERDY